MAEYETTNVIICGCGPTGAMLSSHLGRLGVENICIDQSADITTDPRGIALDEDGIRALQNVGLYDHIYSELGRCMGVFNFVGGRHSNLMARPMMRMDYRTSEGGTGHVGFICHKQPVLEKYLRKSLNSQICSLQLGCSLMSISEEKDWVYAEYKDGQGAVHRLRSKFLVGADGKTGFTRKSYLEPRGILLQQASLTSYDETWVAINWKMTLPTPTTHPDFPLWRLGYTPQEVYDLFFPTDFRFLCNPERAAVCGRFGLPEDRLWRFEFVVHEDEDQYRLSEPDELRRVVYPYITHPGKRYGIKQEVQYPADCIETLRARPFRFSARSCNKWALGRVILCGDSAHVFPPFGGQGITSGFRDACSLAWRLRIACQPNFVNYTPLLAAWYHERKQQLDRSLAATVENGQCVTERNRLKIFSRNVYLWFVQLIPSWKRWLEKGARRLGLHRYIYEAGMHFLPKFGGGILFPQVYCARLGIHEAVSTPAEVEFSDDIIFSPQKRGLFQLVLLADKYEEVASIIPPDYKVESLSGGHVLGSECITIVQSFQTDMTRTHTPKNKSATHHDHVNGSVVRLATASEFAKSRLCVNRPAPEYYDEHIIRKYFQGKRYLILRDDRFVFAACKDMLELEEALGQIEPVLNSCA